MREPRTSAAPPTTSSARSATSCTPATRPRPASRPSCWPSSRWPSGRWRRWASSSGRWSSSRPTTPWPRPRPDGRDRPEVERIWICTPDKDLAQCVRGDRVVLRDRRRERTIDDAGVREKWGVPPGLDPRLPGPRRRLGRRLPGPARLGRPVRRRRAGPLRAPRGDPRGRRRLARGRALGAAPSTPRCGRAGRTRCCTGVWRHCATDVPLPQTDPRSCAGTGRGGPTSRRCARSWASRAWPNGRTSGGTRRGSAVRAVAAGVAPT